jgi:hypothetical protein
MKRRIEIVDRPMKMKMKRKNLHVSLCCRTLCKNGDVTGTGLHTSTKQNILVWVTSLTLPTQQ